MGWEFFPSPCPERLWNPPSLLSNGYEGFFLGVKRPGHEAEHSPPSGAEVKHVWRYTYAPHGVVLIKKAQWQLYLYRTQGLVCDSWRRRGRRVLYL